MISPRKRRILDMLEGGPVTILQVIDHTDYRPSDVRKIIKQMVEEKLIVESCGRYQSNMVVGSPWHKWMKRS